MSLKAEIKAAFLEYKVEIDEKISRGIEIFSEKYQVLDLNLIKKIFWEYVDGIPLSFANDLDDWICKFVYWIYHESTQELSYRKGNIPKEYFIFFSLANNYLFERIFPFKEKTDFLCIRNIYLRYPVGDPKRYNQIYYEFLQRFGEADLIEIIGDKSIPMYDRIGKFKDQYIRQYNLIISRCGEFGKQLARNETGDENKYGNKLHSIFQLYKDNSKTPPEPVKTMLLEFLHLRNAVSHPESAGIIPLDGEKIRIEDRNHKGELTYENEDNIRILWEIFQLLMMFDMALTVATCKLDVYYFLEELYNKYLVKVTCDICNQNYWELFLPERQDYKCKYCHNPVDIV